MLVITAGVQWSLAKQPLSRSNAAVFLTVIAGFGIFIAPFTGVMLADYFVVRKRTLVMEDLYIRSPESIYWFWNGFNWRPLVAWIIGLAPLFPGFIMSVTNADAWNGWVKLFHIDFYVGKYLHKIESS